MPSTRVEKAKMVLQMGDAVYRQVRAHGEQTYPDECCGVLLGFAQEDRNQVEAAIPAGNTRTDSARNRYHIDPQELIRIQRQAREGNLDIVGFYHSHPDHPAQWSVTDWNEAHWLGCSYVITSIEAGVAQTTNSFLLAGTGEDDKLFQKQEIQVQDLPAGAQRCRPSAP